MSWALSLAEGKRGVSQTIIEEPPELRWPHRPRKVGPWGPAAWQVGDGTTRASIAQQSGRACRGTLRILESDPYSF